MKTGRAEKVCRPEGGARKAYVSPLEVTTLGLRLALVATAVTAVLLSPFLFWEFILYGVIPAIAGHGDAGMVREGREIAQGDGIRVAALIVIGAPLYAVVNILPRTVDRIARGRLGLEAADNTGSAPADADGLESTRAKGIWFEGDIAQVNPSGRVTPYGLPD